MVLSCAQLGVLVKVQLLAMKCNYPFSEQTQTVFQSWQKISVTASLFSVKYWTCVGASVVSLLPCPSWPYSPHPQVNNVPLSEENDARNVIVLLAHSCPCMWDADGDQKDLLNKCKKVVQHFLHFAGKAILSWHFLSKYHCFLTLYFANKITKWDFFELRPALWLKLCHFACTSNIC